MLSTTVAESSTLIAAGEDLLAFITDPKQWVPLERLRHDPHARPGQNPSYQRNVGNLGICASIDVAKNLEVFLRVAFRAPNLTPAKASDHLAEFLRAKIPLTPGSEWQVHVDSKKWIHFIRRYSAPPLKA
jgi:hypothetical protein